MNYNYLMKKILLVTASVILLTSCGEQDVMDKYFANCVDNFRAVVRDSLNAGLDACEFRAKTYPYEFRYLKGKVFSKLNNPD
jgi:hypothetical protein